MYHWDGSANFIDKMVLNQRNDPASFQNLYNDLILGHNIKSNRC